MGILTSDELTLKQLVKPRSSNILVVGLGKMGLPIAMCFTNAGFMVNGLDVSEQVVSDLNRGITSIDEPYVEERLKEAISKNLFNAILSVEEAVQNVDFIIVIIPVLVDASGRADLVPLKRTYEKLAAAVTGEVIFVQESTLPPGTTQQVLKPLLEAQGMEDGRDFGLVFAPERTFSGRAIKDIEENYPKIIGATHPNAVEPTKLLYEQIAKKGVIAVSDATTAEAIKTFKGAYRDANIAIANQFAILADKLGIDVMEVIEVANTEPFSHIHTPGIGVGGHCIPVYPHFVINIGKKFEYEPEILSVSRHVNDDMVRYAIEKVEEITPSWDRNVLVLGLAYRGGVKEHRLSPTIRLVQELRMKGIERLKVMDPLYSASEVDALFGKGTGYDRSDDWQRTVDSALQWSSIVFIVTDHKEFKELNYLLLSNKIVYDGRYVLNETLARDFYLLQPGRIKKSLLQG